MNVHKLILFLLFTFLFLGLSAQEFFFNTEIINVEQGLPNRRVYRVTQDLEGFIWVSTPGKISRYDGKNFKSYTASFLNINESLPTHLAIDDSGLLWYCEYLSLSETNTTGIINTKTNEIIDLETISNGLIKNNTVIKIAEARATGKVLIETKTGEIYQYKDGQFLMIFKFPDSKDSFVYSIFQEFEEGVFWIGRGENLYKVSNNRILEQFRIPASIIDMEPFKEGFAIRTTFEVQTQLWKLENGQIRDLKNEKLREPNLVTIHNTFNDYYFLCSDKIIFKNKANEIIYQYEDFPQFSSLENKRIKLLKVFVDKQNTHWITTENGLIKISVQKNNFQILEKNNSVRGIYKTKEKLWIGGYFNNRGDFDSAVFDKIIQSPNIAMSGFTKDTSNNLWIGTTSRFILKYNLVTKNIEKVGDNSGTVLLPYFNKYLNKIFIGQENGISVFNPNTKQFSYLKLPISRNGLEVRQFLEKYNDIWIVTNKGLLIMNKQTGLVYGHLDKTDGFPSDNFNHLHIDDDGIFWIGTRENGLIRWDKNKDKIKIFSRENGLSNNNIYAVYEDDFGCLWLPTDYGLNRFDKNSLERRIFLPEDGIAHEEFNTFAHYKDEAGNFYFGGLNGVTAFHPKDFVSMDFYPKLKLINIEKSKKDAVFSESILQEFIDKKAIELGYNEANIQLSLALLDYVNPKKNQYAYKLKGFNNQWIYTETNNITLSNLPSGNYNLLLKAKSATGNNAAEILTIPIFIEYPIYKKSWFILLIVITIAILIYLGIQWRFSKLENDRLLLEQEVEKRTKTILQQTEDLKALDKAKTQFFSNITHEFRTPLTLIIGPLEQLLHANLNANVQNQLKGIYKNANHLKSLINQLLDLSKIESGNMQVEITYGDLIVYSKDLVERFRAVAAQKNQTLIFESNLEIWETYFDKEKWQKIVFNLLSNAIKFTPENGKIELQIKQSKMKTQDAISLQVIDNGIGIPKDKQKNVFKRFYQADASTTRIQDGTGIGLALVKELISLQKGTIQLKSEVNQGSTFSVLLPILKNNAVINKDKNKSQSTENEQFELEVILENIASIEKTALQGNSENNDKNNQLELLIIEDNAEIRTYIRSCIDETIYKITEAENGEIGIKQASEMIPDLIISDVMMPKKDGFEVVETIRKQQSTSHIPIILLTAKSSLESRLKGLSRGADAYLTKPFSPEELRLRVQKLIELRQLFQSQSLKTMAVTEDKPVENPIKLLENIYEKEDAFLEALRIYIEDNIDDYNMNGETIALHFAMSRMQLHRKLKALTDISISLFIKKIRLKKAIDLMKTQDLNISEIAYQVGFTTPAQFSKTFKKETGSTPSQFLEGLRSA